MISRAIFAVSIVLALVSIAWTPLFVVNASAEENTILEEDWEGITQPDWTLNGAAARDCLEASSGSCSLLLNPQIPSTSASARYQGDQPTSGAPFVASFTFKLSSVESATDTFTDMAFNNGERVRLQTGGSGQRISTEQAEETLKRPIQMGPDGGESSTDGTTSGSATDPEENILADTWYRVILEYNYTALTVTSTIKSMSNATILQAAPLNLTSGITSLTEVQFHATYKGPDIVTSPPASAHYDDFRYIEVTPPAAPTAVAAVPGPLPGEITIAWVAPPNDPRAPTMHYRVYMGENATHLEAITNTTLPNHTVTGVGNDATRFFRVSAVNVAGEGERSELTNATTFRVPGPTEVQATDGNGVGRVKLNWNRPLDDGGMPPLNYTIYSGATTESLTPLRTINATKRTVFLDQMTPTAAYVFAVTSTNAVGESALSSPVSYIVPAAPYSGDECDIFSRLVGRTDIAFVNAATQFCFVTEDEILQHPPMYVYDGGLVNLTKMETFLDVLDDIANETGRSFNRSMIRSSLMYQPVTQPGDNVTFAGPVAKLGPFELPPPEDCDPPPGENSCEMLPGTILRKATENCYHCLPPPSDQYDRSVYTRLSQEADEEVALDIVTSDPMDYSEQTLDGIHNQTNRLLNDPFGTAAELADPIEEVAAFTDRAPILISNVTNGLQECAQTASDPLAEPSDSQIPSHEEIITRAALDGNLDCIVRSLTQTPLGLLDQPLGILDDLTPNSLRLVDDLVEGVGTTAHSVIAAAQRTVEPLAAGITSRLPIAVDIDATLPTGPLLADADARLSRYGVYLPTGANLSGERGVLLSKAGTLRSLSCAGTCPAWNVSGQVGNTVEAVKAVERVVSVIHTAPAGGGEIRIHPLLLNSRTCIKVETVGLEESTPCQLFATIIANGTTGVSILIERSPTAAYVNNVDLTAYFHLPSDPWIYAARVHTSGEITTGLPEFLWINATSDVGADPNERSFDYSIAYADPTMTRFTSSAQFGAFEFTLTDVTRAGNTGNWSVAKLATASWPANSRITHHASELFSKVTSQIWTTAATTLELTVADVVASDQSPLRWALQAPTGHSKIEGSTTPTTSSLAWTSGTMSQSVAYDYAMHGRSQIVSLNGTEIQPSLSLAADTTAEVYQAAAFPTQEADVALAYGKGSPAGCALAERNQRSFIVKVEGSTRCVAATLGNVSTIRVENSATQLTLAASSPVTTTQPMSILIRDAIRVIFDAARSPAEVAVYANATSTPLLERTLEVTQTADPGSLRFDAITPHTAINFNSTRVPLRFIVSAASDGIGRAEGSSTATFRGAITSTGLIPTNPTAADSAHARLRATSTGVAFGFKATDSLFAQVQRNAVTIQLSTITAQNFGAAWANGVDGFRGAWSNAGGAPFRASMALSPDNIRYDHASTSSLGTVLVEAAMGSWTGGITATVGQPTLNIDSGWSTSPTAPPNVAIASSAPVTGLQVWAAPSETRVNSPTANWVYLSNSENPGLSAKFASVARFSAVAKNDEVNITEWVGGDSPLEFISSVAQLAGGGSDVHQLVLSGATNYGLGLRERAFGLEAGSGAQHVRYTGARASGTIYDINVTSPPPIVNYSWGESTNGLELELRHSSALMQHFNASWIAETAPSAVTTHFIDVSQAPASVELSAWSTNATLLLEGRTTSGSTANIGRIEFGMRAGAEDAALPGSKVDEDHVLFTETTAGSTIHAKLASLSSARILQRPGTFGLALGNPSHVTMALGSSPRTMLFETVEQDRPTIRYWAEQASGALSGTLSYTASSGAFELDASGTGQNATWLVQDERTGQRNLRLDHDLTTDLDALWQADEAFTFSSATSADFSIASLPTGAMEPQAIGADFLSIDTATGILATTINDTREVTWKPLGGIVRLIGDVGMDTILATNGSLSAIADLTAGRPESLIIDWSGNERVVKVVATSTHVFDLELGVDIPSGIAFSVDGTELPIGTSVVLDSDRDIMRVGAQAPAPFRELRAVHAPPASEMAWKHLRIPGARLGGDATRLNIADASDVNLTSAGPGNMSFSSIRSAAAAAIDASLLVERADGERMWSNITASSGSHINASIETGTQTICVGLGSPSWDSLSSYRHVPPPVNATRGARQIGTFALTLSGGNGLNSLCLDSTNAGLWLDSGSSVPIDSVHFDGSIGDVTTNLSAQSTKAFDFNTSVMLSSGTWKGEGSGIGRVLLRMTKGLAANTLPGALPGRPEDQLALIRSANDARIYANLPSLTWLSWTAPGTAENPSLEWYRNGSAASQQPVFLGVSQASSLFTADLPEGVLERVAILLQPRTSSWTTTVDSHGKPIEHAYADSLGRAIGVDGSFEGRVTLNGQSRDPAAPAARPAYSVTAGTASATGIVLNALWGATMTSSTLEKLAVGETVSTSVDPVTLEGSATANQFLGGLFTLLLVPDSTNTVKNLHTRNDHVFVESSTNAPYVGIRLSQFKAAEWSAALTGGNVRVMIERDANVTLTFVSYSSSAGDILNITLMGAHDFDTRVQRTNGLVSGTITSKHWVNELAAGATLATSGTTVRYSAYALAANAGVTFGSNPPTGHAEAVYTPVAGSSNSALSKGQIETSDQGIYSHLVVKGLQKQATVDVGACQQNTPFRMMEATSTLGLVTIEHTYGTAPPAISGGPILHATCEDYPSVMMKLPLDGTLTVDSLTCGFKAVLPGINGTSTPFYLATVSARMDGVFRPQATAATLSFDTHCDNDADTKRAHTSFDVATPVESWTDRIEEFSLRYSDVRPPVTAADPVLNTSCMMVGDACLKVLDIQFADIPGNATFNAVSGGSLADRYANIELLGAGDIDVGNAKLFMVIDANEDPDMPPNMLADVRLPLDKVNVIYTNVATPRRGHPDTDVIDIIKTEGTGEYPRYETPPEMTVVINMTKFKDLKFEKNSSGVGFSAQFNLYLSYNSTIAKELNVYYREADCDVNRFTVKPLPAWFELTVKRTSYITMSATVGTNSVTGIETLRYENRMGSSCTKDNMDLAFFAEINKIPHGSTWGWHLQPEGYLKMGQVKKDTGIVSDAARVGSMSLGFGSSTHPDRRIEVGLESFGIGLQWNIWPGANPTYLECWGEFGKPAARALWDGYGAGAQYNVTLGPQGNRTALRCPDPTFSVPSSWFDVMRDLVIETIAAERRGCVLNPGNLTSPQAANFSLGPWTFEVWIAGVRFTNGFDWLKAYNKTDGDCRQHLGT